MTTNNSNLLLRVEQIVLELISTMIKNRNLTLQIPRNCSDWFKPTDNGPVSPGIRNYRNVSFNRRKSRHRFCLIIYLLAEVHRLQIFGGSCTIRGLYYQDTQMIRSQSYISAANLDVCRMLNTSPVHLGIRSAAKGLVSGDIKLIMSNGDVLDGNVYCGAITLPTDFENVERIVTNAEMLLIVEKESVFESLLNCNAFSTFGLRFILITGKGYPDCTTRRMVYRLSVECHLPAYILVDADPFGIDIMLIYQYGSQTMSFSSTSLATPMLRWIGLHPTEVQSIAKRSVPLTQYDNKKIIDLLSRTHISRGVRLELCRLQETQLHTHCGASSFSSLASTISVSVAVVSFYLSLHFDVYVFRACASATNAFQL